VSDADALTAARSNARKALAALDAFDAIVENYVTSSGVAIARFGLEAGGQPEFIYKLRRGTDFRRSTMRRVLDHIASA
jgi:predicted transcriptional regulator